MIFEATILLLVAFPNLCNFAISKQASLADYLRDSDPSTVWDPCFITVLQYSKLKELDAFSELPCSIVVPSSKVARWGGIKIMELLQLSPIMSLLEGQETFFLQTLLVYLSYSKGQINHI